MYKFLGLIVTGGLLVAASAAGGAAGQPPRPVERAFEHYERIRVALAQDTTRGIAPDAQALSPLAGELGGDQARRAADALAQAGNLAQARERFATLSEALVPALLDAGLPDVHGFVCSMKRASWVQRGSSVANPYYGTAMATCGTPIKVDARQ